MSTRLEALRAPLVPNRVRCIGGQGFSFIPHRFLRDGFLEALGRDELALYLFLVLAGNRAGVSFYRYDAICSTLGLSLDDYISARNGLIDRDLIVFDGTRYQVLSLPEPSPASNGRSQLKSPADYEENDPATIRSVLLSSLKSGKSR